MADNKGVDRGFLDALRQSASQQTSQSAATQPPTATGKETPGMLIDQWNKLTR